jgi:HNH endonuclease
MQLVSAARPLIPDSGHPIVGSLNFSITQCVQIAGASVTAFGYIVDVREQNQLDVSGIIIPRLPEVRSEPVGVCIYCGVDKFTPSGGKLSEEHIIPFSINGRYILQEASCKQCAKSTGQFEGILMRGGFRAIREFLQFQSRTKSRPTHLPLFNINHVQGSKVMVPIDDYPVTWMIPRFRLPGILQPPTEARVGFESVWSEAINYDLEKLKGLGIKHFESVKFDVMAFVRMLAKIGHSLAVLRFGPNYFVPFLRHIILHEADETAYQYIGGVPDRRHDSDELHGLTIKQLLVAGRKLVAAEIRLFAHFASPIHIVVVGEVRT